jgi:tetratricopeptide (TPR) repeat protein
VLCQLCGGANPDGLENCRKCGNKLLVLSGQATADDVDAADELLFEAQDELDEHLLERITVLEEGVRQLAGTVAATGENLAQLEHNLAVAHAGIESLAGLLESEGIVTRTEVVDGWERTAGRELLSRDLSRRFRARAGRILSHAKHNGEATREFGLKLGALEASLLDRDPEPIHELLADLARMAPANDELWSFIGEAAFSTGEPKIAETAFRRVIELRGPHFETLIYLGSAASDLGHWDQAVEALLAARTMAPKSFLPHFALGGIELRRRNYRDAARHLETSLDRDEVPQALYLLGTCRLQLGELGRAITALKRAVELDPTFEEAFDRLGAAYLSRGWTRRALETFRRLERLDPQRLRYRETVRLLTDNGVASGLPRDAAHLIDRADTALAGGEAEAALGLYEAAGREAPEVLSLQATAALLASTLGRTRKAVAHARRVLDRQPDGSPYAAAATVALLESLRLAGRMRATRRCADAIYRQGGDDFSRGLAAYELALVESELDGDLKRARSLAREALENTPRELRHYPLAALAAIALRRGRLREARSYLEQATDSGATADLLRHFGDPLPETDRPSAVHQPAADPPAQIGIDHELLTHVRRLSSLAQDLARR